jgi:hypothetical protein
MKDIRVLGAFGYIYQPTSGAAIPTVQPGSSNTYAGSLGVLHVPTGLSINGAAGTTVQLGTNFPGQMNQSFWYVEGGWQGRIWAMGKSYFSVGGGTWNGGLTRVPNNDIHAWRINTAFVQAIDAAATDIYAGYAYYDGKRQGTGLDAGHVIVVGARIKF